MQHHFGLGVLPTATAYTVRLVESPFNPKGKSMRVMADDRAEVISPRNIMSVCARFDIKEDQFRSGYNEFFKLSPPPA